MKTEYPISEEIFRLLPFIKATIAYFTLLFFDLPLILHLAVKVAPIVCLGLFVLHYPSRNDDQRKFKKWILGGITMSCVGDLCVHFQEFFLLGMLSFGLAHCMYLTAFGFKPVRPHYGLFVYLASGYVVQIIMECLNFRVLLYVVPIYACLLGTMSWRSIAQMHDSKGETNWSRICTASGGILWLISDGILGYDKFCSSLPFASVLIMATYYLGQAAIALSVVDCWKK